MTTMICIQEFTAAAPATTMALLLAFELGDRSWKLGFTTGLGQQPRIRQVPAGAIDQVLEEIARAKRRLKLPTDTSVISCYEAEVPPRAGPVVQRNLVSVSGCATLGACQAAEVDRACSGAVEPDTKRGPKFRAPASGNNLGHHPG